MYYIKRDPGCCPVDGSPHTTCCAPSSGGAIVAGPIQTRCRRRNNRTELPAPIPASTATPAPPDPTFTTKHYRGRGKREP